MVSAGGASSGRHAYQLFMLGLSIYVLLALAAQGLFALRPDVLRILDLADFFICFVFFADFLWSLWSAERRSRYFLTWGWLDLLSSVPTIDLLRWGRAARIFRILRVLRGLRATRFVADTILANRAATGLWTVALLTILLVIASSIGVLYLEVRPESQIQTGDDALWWAIVTVTTVGYGDVVPVTPAGRALAVALILCGASLFAAVTAYVASQFLATSERRQDEQLAALRNELADLRELVERQAERSSDRHGPPR